MLLAEGSSFLFNLDAQLLFDTALLAVAVFVLFYFMSYLLFNPARKLLAERQERIKNDIDAAKEEKESAKALKAEYESKLKDIDKEAEVILSEARHKALQNESKIIDEAKQEAARIISDTKPPNSTPTHPITRSSSTSDTITIHQWSGFIKLGNGSLAHVS